MLLRLATVLPVMLALVPLELRMPVTCWPVPEVDEVAAFRLFAAVVLPTVLLLMLFVPALTWMPKSEAEIVVVVEPFTVMEPMVLLAMATVPLLAEPMPQLVPPEIDVVTEMEPVPVPLPMVLPVAVPMFAEPAGT